jgi:hypothetical protein
MYLRQGFHITVISGDQEFSVLNHLTTDLLTTPFLNWVAASQHCGLIECKIRFFEREASFALPQSTVHNDTRHYGCPVVHMVLHIINFVNRFPCQGGVKHFPSGEIMMGRCLHKSNIVLSFGVYCHVAENVQPRNSLAP